MRARKLRIEPSPTFQAGVHRGTVVDVSSEGDVFISCDHAPSPVRCDRLDMGLGPVTVVPSDLVLFCQYEGEPGRGCIVGRVCVRADAGKPQPERVVRIQLDELVISARRRIELSTERAKIFLTSDGELQLSAWNLISRARRLQKLIAPMLRLN